MEEDKFRTEEEGIEDVAEVRLHNINEATRIRANIWLIPVIVRYLLENQEMIARAACLDSGKTMVDAQLGEILVTAEKLKWTINHGEKALKAERRPTNFLMMYKRNEVRYEPMGVVAACVSWKCVLLVLYVC